MFSSAVIGVDLGGTNISIGKVRKNQIKKHSVFNISSQGTERQIIREIIESVTTVFDGNIAGIGVGVPSLVDVEEGIVYNVQNIPSWKEVHLKKVLEEQFRVPIYINNDANCFVVGEKYFGKGRKYKNLVGLTLGTGMGAGVIISNRLYSGVNCGTGEFGSISYKNYNYEYYCSGQFFTNEFNENGQKLFEKAVDGDETALNVFRKFGTHLGNAIITILYAVDPEAIILGGSVSQAFPFFSESMWNQVKTFPYKHAVERLVIEKSEHPQIAVLGAAALYYDAQGIEISDTENIQPI